MRNKAQQEMVGFVLIIAIVIIGLMVFLIIVSKGGGEAIKSLEVDNMLSSILKKSTQCAINFVPQFDNIEDLFRHCYQNKKCANIEKNSCVFLNDTLKDVLEQVTASEATIKAYQLDFSERTDEGEKSILRILGGKCTNATILASQRNIISGTNNLIVRLTLCKEI